MEKKSSSFYSISLWGKKELKTINQKISLLNLLTMNNKERASFFSKKPYEINVKLTKLLRSFITITYFENKNISLYPYESDNTMLFPLIILIMFTLFVGFIGIPFNQEGMDLDILTKWLTPSINLLHSNSENFVDWYEFVINAIFSISIAFFGIFIAFFFYKPIYSSLKNFDLINSFDKRGQKRILGDNIITIIYNWSANRGYIDAFYSTFLIKGIRSLSELVSFFDRRIIDGIPNGFGVTSFFVGEGIKYVGGGRISSYLFWYLLYVSIFLFIFTFT